LFVENNSKESKISVEEQKSIQNNPLEKDKAETTEVENEQVKNEEKNKESDTQK
jgi:hypothetical protein